MTGQEKNYLFNTDDCLIELAKCADFTVNSNYNKNVDIKFSAHDAFLE